MKNLLSDFIRACLMPDLELLECRVAELECDLQSLSALIGDQMGEPYRSKASEILNKRGL